MRILNRKFPLIVLASLLIPALLGGLLSWSLKGAFTGLIWGGFVRIFLQHHVTWSVNSVCHFFGKRRFDVEDQSTNVFWLAIPSFGESWHHNHHAFPRSAAHGLKWWEIDTSAMVIGVMRRIGLAWDVVKIAPGAPGAEARRRAEAGAAAPEEEKVAGARRLAGSSSPSVRIERSVIGLATTITSSAPASPSSAMCVGEARLLDGGHPLRAALDRHARRVGRACRRCASSRAGCRSALDQLRQALGSLW